MGCAGEKDEALRHGHVLAFVTSFFRATHESCVLSWCIFFDETSAQVRGRFLHTVYIEFVYEYW